MPVTRLSKNSWLVTSKPKDRIVIVLFLWRRSVHDGKWHHHPPEGRSHFKIVSSTLIERRVLMHMSVEECRRHLREQADRIAEDYEPDPDWREVEGEDFGFALEQVLRVV